jgi:hypothetical protein
VQLVGNKVQILFRLQQFRERIPGVPEFDQVTLFLPVDQVYIVEIRAFLCNVFCRKDFLTLE